MARNKPRSEKIAAEHKNVTPWQCYIARLSSELGSYKKVSEKLGIPYETVQKTMYRAMVAAKVHRRTDLYRALNIADVNFDEIERLLQLFSVEEVMLLIKTGHVKGFVKPTVKEVETDV